MPPRWHTQAWTKTHLSPGPCFFPVGDAWTCEINHISRKSLQNLSCENWLSRSLWADTSFKRVPGKQITPPKQHICFSGWQNTGLTDGMNTLIRTISHIRYRKNSRFWATNDLPPNLRLTAYVRLVCEVHRGGNIFNPICPPTQSPHPLHKLHAVPSSPQGGYPCISEVF